MAAFGLISLDASKTEPLVILALAGVAGWWLWQHAQAQQAQTAQAQAAASSTQDYINSLEQGALLSNVLGTAGTSQGVVQSGQPTYSAVSASPTNTVTTPAGSTSSGALNAQPSGSGT